MARRYFPLPLPLLLGQVGEGLQGDDALGIERDDTREGLSGLRLVAGGQVDATEDDPGRDVVRMVDQPCLEDLQGLGVLAILPVGVGQGGEETTLRVLPDHALELLDLACSHSGRFGLSCCGDWIKV